MTTEDQTPEKGTETEGTTVETTITEQPTEPEIDYKKKFSESSKEALRLLDEVKAKEKEIEDLRKATEQSGGNYTETTDEPLYPGFETLSDDEKRNLKAYTDSITKKVRDELYSDPSISFAKESFNEKRWNESFEKVANQFPELRESREEFKKQYFNPSNVPQNIDDILGQLSKVYLFDKARDMGAKEAIEKASHIEIERASGGDKTPKASRSLEDWHKLASSDPVKFAKLSKEYNEDLASGRLK